MHSTVCILTSVHSALDTRVFHKEARTLARAGYDVCIIGQHDRDATLDGVKIVALAKPRNRALRMWGTWRILAVALRQKADAYHFHDPELIPVALALKLITGARVVYDVHEDIPRQILTKQWIPSRLRVPASALYRLVQRVSLPLFDAVVAAGTDIASGLPRSSRVVVVGNYPSVSATPERAPTGARKQGRTTLIYVGGITRDRGAQQMIQAIHRLGDRAELVLVGPFSDRQLEADVRAGANDRVRILGQVPYLEVFRLLNTADIGLVCFHPTPNNLAAASRNNKLYEYMVAGLPVIASNFPAWREIVEGSDCGLLVDPLDPTEIADAVEHLIEHPSEAEAMGQRGRRAVHERYNWEKESEKLLTLYDHLLNRSAG